MSAFLKTIEVIFEIKGHSASSASGYPYLSVWIGLEARLQGESGSPMSSTSVDAAQWLDARALFPLRFEQKKFLFCPADQDHD